jgi:hypothetical protein
MLGQTVCRMHGGQAPQALAKAEERIRALVHPAISALAQLIADNDLAAARYVLDYAGFKAAVQVQTEGEMVIRIVNEDQPIMLAQQHANGRAHG